MQIMEEPRLESGTSHQWGSMLVPMLEFKNQAKVLLKAHGALGDTLVLLSMRELLHWS